MSSETTLAVIQESLLQHFGFEARQERLDGERDLNLLVVNPATEEKFVLKVFAANESQAFIEAEGAILGHLSPTNVPSPVIVPTRTGAHQFSVSVDGIERAGRLVEFLPGRVLAEYPIIDPLFWSDFGRCIGQFKSALSEFDHPAIHREFDWELSASPDVIDGVLPKIDDAAMRNSLMQIVSEHRLSLEQLTVSLEQSVIHGDLNDWNVIPGLAKIDDAVSTTLAGVIDFGDMVWSDTINELAIGIAYSVLDRPNPLGIACSIVAAFHKEQPISRDELQILWHRVRLRLALSVAMAARQQAADPSNKYLSISQTPIHRTLPELMRIPAGFVYAAFCQACGLELPAQISTTQQWLDENKNEFQSPIREIAEQRPQRLDWSIGSSLLDGDPTNLQTVVESGTARLCEQNGNAIGVGGWGEPRLIYQSPQFQASGMQAPRTVHLGVDVFAPAGTEVVAPIDGTIHATANINEPLDYGGVLVTRHETTSGSPVFLLYGHLDPESICHWKPGDEIIGGKRIATLGSREVNGGWLPHLHFQILADDFGLATDFPGVCQADWQDLWLSYCPNPGVILRLEAQFVSNRPVKTSDVLKKRQATIGRSVRLSYDEPLQIVRGWKQYLYDESGRRFLDAYNNVPHVGHCHPKVVEATTRQMKILNSNTRYASRLQNRFAERLIETMPAGLDTCFFLSSASEANELALRLARTATGGRDMIVNEHAYHGHTTSLIDISPYKHNGRGGEGAPDWVHAIPVPDLYRGPHRANDPDAALKYARHAVDAIEAIKRRGGRLAGFIAETCPSVAGQIVPPIDYLPEVYKIVRDGGGICIADEVQTGYGRMGDCFYAFEKSCVTPDIVVLGKPIGNGYPLAAVVTTFEIANRFYETGMEFFSTFGGNHVSCAVGLAVLDVVANEGLQDHARSVGESLRQLFASEIGQHPMVGNIRGSGLFWGIELVRDRNSLEPATAAADWIKNQLRRLGILIGSDGPCDNVLKIRPPMPFDEANSERLVNELSRALSSLACEFG